MRLLATAALFVICASSADAADYWQSDNLLACLVGKGAVAMRHGASAAAALDAVKPQCKKAEDAPPKGQDGADYTAFTYATAAQILERAAGVI